MLSPNMDISLNMYRGAGLSTMSTVQMLPIRGPGVISICESVLTAKFSTPKFNILDHFVVTLI